MQLLIHWQGCTEELTELCLYKGTGPCQDTAFPALEKYGEKSQYRDGEKFSNVLKDKSLPSLSYMTLLGTKAVELGIAVEEQMGGKKCKVCISSS